MRYFSRFTVLTALAVFYCSIICYLYFTAGVPDFTSGGSFFEKTLLLSYYMISIVLGVTSVALLLNDASACSTFVLFNGIYFFMGCYVVARLYLSARSFTSTVSDYFIWIGPAALAGMILPVVLHIYMVRKAKI